MSSTDPDPTDNDRATPQMHGGHRLESGILARSREWVDVLPWIRLGRVLRLAGSPLTLIIVALVHVVWSAGLGVAGAAFPPVVLVAGDDGLFRPLGLFLRVAGAINPVSVWADTSSWRLTLGVGVWTALIWTPVLLMLTRQGALLTAGRDLIGTSDALRVAIRRTPVTWLALVTPVVCISALLIPVVALGWLRRGIVGDVSFGDSAGAMSAVTDAVVGVLMLATLLPAGLLALGSFVAIPAAVAAIINEPTPDPLDALSRGYEMVFRRPLQLTGYVLVAGVCAVVIGAMGLGVSWLCESMVRPILPPVAAIEDPRGGGVVTSALHFFPSGLVFALCWGLVGGTFLLLRRDCGGQEVEDVWTPPPRRVGSLPDLPKHEPLPTDTDRP